MTLDELNDLAEMMDPNEIAPRHEVEDWGKFDGLVKSLQADGWDFDHRPLLAYRNSEGVTEGLTGSHRLWAAKQVPGLLVPVVVVDLDDDAREAIESAHDNVGMSDALAGNAAGLALIEMELAAGEQE